MAVALYNLFRLSEIDAEFESWGQADNRLSESAEGGRGCGRIGFLWKKGVAAAPIGGIESDRIACWHKICSGKGGGLHYVSHWCVYALPGSGY